jgi:hypothetical protein
MGRAWRPRGADLARPRGRRQPGAPGPAHAARVERPPDGQTRQGRGEPGQERVPVHARPALGLDPEHQQPRDVRLRAEQQLHAGEQDDAGEDQVHRPERQQEGADDHRDGDAVQDPEAHVIVVAQGDPGDQRDEQGRRADLAARRRWRR